MRQVRGLGSKMCDRFGGRENSVRQVRRLEPQVELAPIFGEAPGGQQTDSKRRPKGETQVTALARVSAACGLRESSIPDQSTDVERERGGHLLSRAVEQVALAEDCEADVEVALLQGERGFGEPDKAREHEFDELRVERSDLPGAAAVGAVVDLLVFEVLRGGRREQTVDRGSVPDLEGHVFEELQAELHKPDVVWLVGVEVACLDEPPWGVGFSLGEVTQREVSGLELQAGVVVSSGEHAEDARELGEKPEQLDAAFLGERLERLEVLFAQEQMVFADGRPQVFPALKDGVLSEGDAFGQRCGVGATL